MKSASILIGFLILGLALVFLLFRSTRNRKPRASTEPDDMYMALRRQVFQASRSTFGLPAGSKPADAWCAIMEWGLDTGTVTVVSIIDGSASVYLSSGGGSIGGGESRESVKKAAHKMVAIATEFQSQMRPTNTYPLPKLGQINFYVLTDAGVFTATGTQEDLSAHRHPLSKLGDAAQDVITQYRLIEEKK